MRLVGGESGIMCFFCLKISKNAEMLQDAAGCAHMGGGSNIQQKYRKNSPGIGRTWDENRCALARHVLESPKTATGNGLGYSQATGIAPIWLQVFLATGIDFGRLQVHYRNWLATRRLQLGYRW